MTTTSKSDATLNLRSSTKSYPIPELAIFGIFLATTAFLCKGAPWGDAVFSYFACSVITAMCLKLGKPIKYAALLVVSLIALLELYVKLRYGGMTITSIGAIIGISFFIPQDGSLSGIVGAVPWQFWTLAASYIASILFCAFKTSRTDSDFLTVSKLTVLLGLLAAFPAQFEINYYGWPLFRAHIAQSPGFFAHHYIEKYRFVFGSTVASALVALDDQVTRTKFAVVSHTKIPPGISIRSAGETNVVLLMGESSNPHFYNVYNDSKDLTTPNLLALRASGKICIVDKAHSNGNQTRTGLPMNISFADAPSFSNLFAYKNIFEMASANGYRTYWLGSSTGGGLWGRTFSYVSNYADVILRPEKTNTPFHIAPSDDDALPGIVEHYFKDKAEKNFYVVHIFGNHMGYTRNVDAVDRAALPNGSDYQLSIHHTDRFIKKIYDLAEKYLGDFQFVYVSDHGEVVGVGHGFSSPHSEMYLVPMIMRTGKYCDYVDKYRSADGFYGTDSNKFLLMHMLGYDVSDPEIEKARATSKLLLTEKDEVWKFDDLVP